MNCAQTPYEYGALSNATGRVEITSTIDNSQKLFRVKWACALRARGGAEPAAGRFSFCKSGWRRSRSVRRRRRAQRATGSTSPPAACTGKLMGLGRVLAPRFQPCPLSVGGTAPSAALAYFLALAWPWPWPSSYGSGSPPAARPRRVSRSENRECIESASERARVDHFCELRARARRSRGRRRPIFFLRIRLAAQRECSAAAPSAASYGVDVAAGGLHRQADGSRPCARSEISAVPFIRWRYGAARRAGLLFGLGRGRRATGQDRRRPLAPGGSRAPKIASALNLHPKGPALITFVHYARARGGAEPAAGRFSFCESGWRRSRSVRRRRRAQRATGSTSPPAACTGKLMGLGRVLAPRFQPCPLSVGGTAPRAALDYFLALAGGATGSGRRRPLAPGGSRAPKIASALNLHPKGPALITFVHYARARGGAEPAAGRFSFCKSGWRRSRSVRRRRRAQRATGSTSPPAACTGKLMGLGRVLAPRFQPCPLSVGGTAPRAALDYFLALAGGATGSGSPPAARTRRVSRSENRECIKSASERARVDHFCALRARARRSRARRRPIFFLRNPVGGAAGVFGGGAERSELRGRRRRRRLAPAS